LIHGVIGFSPKKPDNKILTVGGYKDAGIAIFDEGYKWSFALNKNV